MPPVRADAKGGRAEARERSSVVGHAEGQRWTTTLAVDGSHSCVAILFGASVPREHSVRRKPTTSAVVVRESSNEPHIGSFSRRSTHLSRLQHAEPFVLSRSRHGPPLRFGIVRREHRVVGGRSRGRGGGTSFGRCVFGLGRITRRRTRLRGPGRGALCRRVELCGGRMPVCRRSRNVSPATNL
jgi:hypothetical protein